MKKRIILGGLFIAMLAISSCGKSETDKASEYYQEELGMSEEEADELADELSEELSEKAE